MYSENDCNNYFKKKNMMPEIEHLVTVAQAAKLVKMGNKIELFRYYIEKGYTPETVSVGGKIYFDKRELKDWKPALKRKKKRKYE